MVLGDFLNFMETGSGSQKINLEWFQFGVWFFSKIRK
jgi:hypothetical protein